MHEALSLPLPLISPQKASTSKKSSREDGPPTSGSGASSAGSAPSAAASAARRKGKTGGCPHLVQRGEVWEDFVDEVLGQPLDVEVRDGLLALVPGLAGPGMEGLRVWRDGPLLLPDSGPAPGALHLPSPPTNPSTWPRPPSHTDPTLCSGPSPGRLLTRCCAPTTSTPCLCPGPSPCRLLTRRVPLLWQPATGGRGGPSAAALQCSAEPGDKVQGRGRGTVYRLL